MPPRRFLLILVLAVAGLAFAWWLLYVPYRPERVFAAIPASARMVGVEQDLAGQWDTLIRNPVLADLLNASGVKEEARTALATNRVARQWIRRLASDQSVVALLPAPSRDAKPTVAFASWIGNQSRLLRWQAAWISSRDLRPAKLDKGRLTVWRVRTDLDKANLHLSLALSEGLVLGCLSEDPIAVRSLLETAEGYPGRPSLASSGQPALARTLLPAPRVPWGWINTTGKTVAWQLDLGERTIALDLLGNMEMPPAPPLRDCSGIGIVNHLTATTSDLVMLMPLSWLHHLVPAEPPALWEESISELSDPRDAKEHALAFIAVLDPSHNGRLRGPLGSTLRSFVKGVKTPTLLVGLQLGTTTEADSRMKRAVETLNSRYGLRLGLRPVAGDGEPAVTLIEESRKNIYGSFEPGERVAYAMADDWLILASHATILKKVLRTPRGLASVVPDTTPPPVAAGRVALGNLSGTVKTATGAMKLATLLKPTEEADPLRKQLDAAGRWADMLRTWGEASLTASSSGGVVRAHFQAVKQPATEAPPVSSPPSLLQ